MIALTDSAELYPSLEYKLGVRARVIEVFNALQDDMSIAICFEVRRWNLKVLPWFVSERVSRAKHRIH